MRLIKLPMPEPWLEKYVPMTGRGFVDVGSNMGDWSRWLAPGYKFIHAVEPHQAARDAAGALPANVTQHATACWSEEARIHFGVEGNLLFAQEDIESAVRPFIPIDANSLVLPCQTLDSLVPEKEEIDFVKVDTDHLQTIGLLEHFWLICRAAGW
jgi:FkbM family methyltransferase